MIGELLKEWRQLRGLSQLDLGMEADVSARHISFMETGRSRPSAEMVLRLAEVLDIPLRGRNALLMSAGHSPHYRDSDLEHEDLIAVRKAISLILTSHEPFPAVAVDSAFNIIDANSGFAGMAASSGMDMAQGSANLVQQLFEDGPMRAMITNWDEVVAHMITRMRSDVRMRGPSSPLAGILEAALEQPDVKEAAGRHVVQPNAPFVPFKMDIGGFHTNWFTTITTFGAPQDAYVAELAIEQFHPADEETEKFVRDLAKSTGGPNLQ